MSVRLIETDAGVMTLDCWYICAPGVTALCDDDNCVCEHHKALDRDEDERRAEQ